MYIQIQIWKEDNVKNVVKSISKMTLWETSLIAITELASFTILCPSITHSLSEDGGLQCNTINWLPPNLSWMTLEIKKVTMEVSKTMAHQVNSRRCIRVLIHDLANYF